MLRLRVTSRRVSVAIALSNPPRLRDHVTRFVEKGPVLTAGSRPRGLTFYVFLSYIIRKLCLLIYHSSPTID